MNNRYIASILIVFLLLFTGCTKENNNDDCSSGLKLKFSFTLHTENGDRFSQNAEVVRVYCFNSNNILCHVQEELVSSLSDRSVMRVNIAPGEYKIVAWAGSHSDLQRCYTLFNTEIGKSTLEEFRLKLNGRESDDPRFIAPSQDDLDNLYFGALGDRHAQSSLYELKTINVTTGKSMEYPIDLIRYTNILKVTISGVKNIVGGDNFKMWVTAQNGEYNIFNNNLIDENSLKIKHTPLSVIKEDDSLVANFKLLRLMENNLPAPIQLYIETSNGKQLFTAPLNVIEILKKARDTKTGDYIYKSQSDFDRIYEHNIKFVIGSDLKVKIFIGEWEIIEVVPVS